MYILTQLHITVRSSLSPLDVKILENFLKSRQSIAKGNTGIKIYFNNEKRRCINIKTRIYMYIYSHSYISLCLFMVNSKLLRSVIIRIFLFLTAAVGMLVFICPLHLTPRTVTSGQLNVGFRRSDSFLLRFWVNLLGICHFPQHELISLRSRGYMSSRYIPRVFG